MWSTSRGFAVGMESTIKVTKHPRARPNQPLERTPPCCALRCRSSARHIAEEDGDQCPRSRFLGIVIAMFYNDHAPAHFHAR